MRQREWHRPIGTRLAEEDVWKTCFTHHKLLKSEESVVCVIASVAERRKRLDRNLKCL